MNSLFVKSNHQISNEIYNVSIVLYIVWYVLRLTTLGNNSLMQVLRSLIMGLLLTKVLSKYSKKQLIRLIFFGLLGALGWIFSDLPDILFFFLFYITSNEVNLKLTQRKAFYTYCVMIMAVYFMFRMGILEDVVKRWTLSGTPGHSYGFGHPNMLALVVLQPITLWIYSHFNDMKVYHYLIVVAIVIEVYSITQTRTLVAAALLLLFLIPNINFLAQKKFNNVVAILVWTPMVFAIASLLLTALDHLNIGWVKTLNLIFTNRIHMQALAVQKYGISLIPSVQIYNESSSTGSILYLDNSYIKMVLNFGIIIFLVIIGIYVISMYKMYKYEKYGALTVMTVVCAIGIVETVLYRMGVNIALLILFEFIDNYHEHKSSLSGKRILRLRVRKHRQNETQYL